MDELITGIFNVTYKGKTFAIGDVITYESLVNRLCDLWNEHEATVCIDVYEDREGYGDWNHMGVLVKEDDESRTTFPDFCDLLERGYVRIIRVENK